jgi:hypothetical protein
MESHASDSGLRFSFPNSSVVPPSKVSVSKQDRSASEDVRKCDGGSSLGSEYVASTRSNRKDNVLDPPTTRTLDGCTSTTTANETCCNSSPSPPTHVMHRISAALSFQLWSNRITSSVLESMVLSLAEDFSIASALHTADCFGWKLSERFRSALEMVEREDFTALDRLLEGSRHAVNNSSTVQT